MSQPMPLDELYLNWLYSQVGDVRRRNPRKTFWSILRLLYVTQFIWMIPNDDNRVEDGKNLRYEFLHENQINTVDRNWMQLPCSFLEMLVALSRRLAFEADGETADWFWHLMGTLDLIKYNDGVQIPHEQVEDILNRVMYRTYRVDGHGGLFPLKNNHGLDQTKVEIWYQLNAYLMENNV